MDKIVSAASVLVLSNLVLSVPATAGCAEDLEELAFLITTQGVVDVTNERLQKGLVVLDDAKASCDIGDEEDASAKIDETKAILGLVS